ncbi:hypothetical protein LCGC14_0412400 [marine sediment metagenome]|uniref:Uncharacterized protein n=1 Tax=marine sediment metagenome TaxID=412755 RepID=A0A0F9SZB2_9ZZZZ
MALLKAIHGEELSVVGTTQLETLGALRLSLDGLSAYRYCYATEAILQGECVYQGPLASYSLYQVSIDLSDDCPLVAGVALYSIPSGSYGWVQVAGQMLTIRSMNDIALKDALVGHATTDGEADGDDTTGNEHIVFGMALGAATTFEDDNGTTLDCCIGFLHNCLFKP